MHVSNTEPLQVIPWALNPLLESDADSVWSQSDGVKE